MKSIGIAILLWAGCTFACGFAVRLRSSQKTLIFPVVTQILPSAVLLKYHNDCGLASRMNPQHATQNLEVKGTNHG